MRRSATRFEDLVVWQEAHQFVLAAYRFSRTFPRSETYGLASQFRRAAVSIAVESFTIFSLLRKARHPLPAHFEFLMDKKRRHRESR
ncbi:MAG: four helix bundle protein [Armatimonadetes bacterium]|nr:four helix bundle protein [Armatimonadota bacterium]